MHTETPLVTELSRMFSAEFLTNPFHTLWRSTISPLPGTVEYSLLKIADDNASREPPFFPISKLASCVAVAALTSVGAPEGASQKCVEEVATALASVPTAVVSGVNVRRREMIASEEDPHARVVVVKPLALTSEDNQSTLIARIMSFFSKFGPVSGVELNRWGTVSGAEVTFCSHEAASACVEGRSSYCGSDEVRESFLPNADPTRKLQVFSKPVFCVLQQEIVQNQQQEWAKKRLAEAESERRLGEENGVSFISSRRYHPNTLLVVRGKPSTSTWNTIKTKLTNLFPEDSSIIQLVKDQDDDTFIIARSAEDVGRILDAYKAAVAAEAAAAANPPPTAGAEDHTSRPVPRKPKTPLAVVVPNLEAANEGDEDYIKQLYPVWMAGAVSKKISTNILHKAGTKRGRN